MRLTAQRLMAGDWSRRIPLSRTDDDLTALARTFNRLFDRIEKLLQANKQVSADIAHDLRKPLATMLRRLEAARGDDASPDMEVMSPIVAERGFRCGRMSPTGNRRCRAMMA